MSDEAFIEKWAERIAGIAYAAEGAVHQGATMNVAASARIEVAALVAELRASTPPAAPLVFAPEEREALEPFVAEARERIAYAKVYDVYGYRIAPAAILRWEIVTDLLDRILAASPSQPACSEPGCNKPRDASGEGCCEEHETAHASQPVAPAAPPETSEERRAAARAVHEASGKVTVRVGKHEIRVKPPATPPAGEPMTVAIRDLRDSLEFVLGRAESAMRDARRAFQHIKNGNYEAASYAADTAISQIDGIRATPLLARTLAEPAKEGA